jgi:hypothetical protein
MVNERTSDRQDAPSDEAASEGSRLGSLSDLGMSLFDTAVAKPYNATAGLVLPQMDLSHSYDHHSWAAKAGEFGGGVIDVVALTKLSSYGVGKGMNWGVENGMLSASLAKSPMLASTLTLGTTGALYGGVFTSGDAATRLKNAAIGAGTFAVLGASTVGLGRLAFLGEAGSRTLVQDMAIGGLSGLPAGVANAELTSLTNGHGLTFDSKTVGSSALYYGLFGATMSGAMHGLVSAVEGGRNTAVREPASITPLAESSLKPPADAATAKPFNIPESGYVELGKMMRQTPAEDQIRLVQQVVESRPGVPVGSWMRLIEPQDMPQFLRAIDQMYPDTALKTADYLIETGNLRPATPESEPIDFNAWKSALQSVEAEKAAQTAAGKDAVMQAIAGAAEKPFTLDDVTMTVRDQAALKESIAKNADSAVGSRVFNFANKWATIMEGKMSSGEPLSVELIRQAEHETGLQVQNYEFAIARNLLVDTWQHGPELERLILPSGFTEAELASVTGSAKPEVIRLNAAQEAELNNIGSMLPVVASSREGAIQLVRGMDPANVDPAVRTVLLDTLLESQAFLRSMGVDAVESNASIVNAMQNVPQGEIPRFVHYADQFHGDPWPHSVMSAMDQAVARGDVPAGTQQAWIDAISAKLRIVFPGIKESDWAMSSMRSGT